MYVYVCMYVYIYIHTYIHIHIHMFVCVCVCVCTHTTHVKEGDTLEAAQQHLKEAVVRGSSKEAVVKRQS